MPFSHLPRHNDEDNATVREVSLNISHMDLRRLRIAIQKNQISFPAQVPIFACQSRADIQWRLVELYFVHNWSCAELGERYHVAMERIRQLLTQWVRRAAVLGYLQEIPVATTSPAKGNVRRHFAPAPLSEHLVLTATASNAM